MAAGTGSWAGQMPQRGAAFRRRDRSAEFRRARRHSTVVRLLKVMLPLASLGILSLYLLPAFLTMRIDGGKGQASVEAITLEQGALKMVNPRVKGVNDKQGAYDVHADSATQEASNPDILHLDKVDGTLTNKQGQVTVLTAPGSVYNSKIEEMTFDRGLLISRKATGMEAKFKTAIVYVKEQKAISNDPVEVRMDDSTIFSDRLTLYTGDAKAIFEGNVRAHLQRRTPAKAAPSAGADPAHAANPAIDSARESPPDDRTGQN
jgi:lipopolysaccharide export system protein LptC